MNTETKFVLSMIVICAIIVVISIMNIISVGCGYEETSSEPPKTTFDEIVTEVTEKETIIKPSVEETENTTRNTETDELTSTETTTESQTYNTTTQIHNATIGYANYSVPSNNTIKSYMDYRCITLTTSKQYELQTIAYTGNHGIRMINDRYCVALGSYYTTTIGQHVDIELKNGKVIKGILADCKDDSHTDSTNRINPNGSVVEFVVDTKTLDSMAKKMGDISYVNDWNSKVVNIKVYDKVEKF